MKRKQGKNNGCIFAVTVGSFTCGSSFLLAAREPEAGNFRAVRLGAPFQLSLAGIHLTLFPKKSERKSHFKLVCD